MKCLSQNNCIFPSLLTVILLVKFKWQIVTKRFFIYAKLFPVPPMHSLSITYINIYLFCSYTTVAGAHGSMLSEIAGKEQMSLTKQHDGISTLLLLLNFLQVSEGIKQINSFFPLSCWGTLNWLPTSECSDMGISHNFKKSLLRQSFQNRSIAEAFRSKLCRTAWLALCFQVSLQLNPDICEETVGN